MGMSARSERKSEQERAGRERQSAFDAWAEREEAEIAKEPTDAAYARELRDEGYES
jgi:hypothetical protein